MFEAGLDPDVVVDALGAGRSTVYKWLAIYRYRGGPDALLSVKRSPGGPSKLSAKAMARLYGLITGHDPRQLHFELALWTRDMIADLVEREFGVRMHPTTVGRVLRKMGLSPQRPLYRAYEQNPEAVRRWKAEEYPQIVAEAKKAGALVYFGDEASIRSDFHSGTTWAAVGQTPVVAKTGNRTSVGMISAITAGGSLRFETFTGTFNSVRFIDFCTKLLHDTDRPVFLILDRHSAHNSRVTMEYVNSTNGRLRLFYLPSYSPELNPDEWVWKNVKHDRVGKAGVLNKDQLFTAVTNALTRLQKLPRIVRAFFGDPCLRYITHAHAKLS